MRAFDADKLLDILDVMIVGHKSASDVYDVVDRMPTVDAVEVVRCKDCKWYERRYPWNGNSYECSYLEAPMDDNDFCSWGERREDGKTD